VSDIARLSVSVTVRSPFIFQGLANSRFGIDAAFLRDERGRPIIPADQIRGVLQAACRVLTLRAPKIAPTQLVDRLFGDESAKGSNDAPVRALLMTADLVANIESPVTTTTRIEIDDVTGAAASGALQVIELAAPLGASVAFEGAFVLLAETGIVSRDVETLLSRAIRLVPAIGAFKSAGFGEVTAAAIRLTGSRPAAVAATGLSAERVAYRVTFDRPILVDAVRETENLFVGSRLVPGAAFKGALANLLKLADHDPGSGAWADAVAALHISHAFPENDAEQLSGFLVPASLYAWQSGGDVRFADGLLHALNRGDDIAGFVTEEGGVFVAPVHPVDWKDNYFAALSDQEVLPEPALPTPQPRTHVRIDPRDLVAVDAALFTTVAQGVLRDRETPRAWRLVVDMRHVAAEFRVPLLGLIEGGLFPIGRTSAEARFAAIREMPNDAGKHGRIRLVTPPPATALPGHADLHALTLITPALLTDPQSADGVEEQYRRLIRAQSGGTLLRAYTSLRLAGGYIATRRRPYGATYYPFVLTEPGSVFLIKGGDAGKLAAIARFGLAPVALSDVPTLDWRNCPYLRENGYGEVVFSLIDHVQLAARSAANV
jgi:hypothetical protein